MEPRHFTFPQAFLACALAIAVAAPALAQTAKQSYRGHEAVANEVLVKFQQAPPNNALAAADISANVQQEEAAAHVDLARGVGSAGWTLLHSSAYDVTTLMSMFTGAASVVHVEPDWVYHTTAVYPPPNSVVPDDPQFPNQWGMDNTGQQECGQTGTPGADIGAKYAWYISRDSGTNVVGVLDTGIDYNHPDLAANVWSAPSQFSFYQGSTQYTCPAGSHGWNVVANPPTCDPMDDDLSESHGTHVSGTIGAVSNNGTDVAGINWSTKIIAAKMCDSSQNCYTDKAIEALQFMEGVKAAFGGKGGSADIRVLNNSWGCEACFSQALLDEINNADEADMLFVAAAGNQAENNDNSPFYPASYSAPNIISVAATDNQDNLWSLSDWGTASVDLGAPGFCVESTALSSLNPPYEYLSGTSMASAHVAGTSALTLSVCDGDTQWLSSNILLTVIQIPALNGKTETGGRVNAYKSLAEGSVACPGTGDAVVSGSEKHKTELCGPGCRYTIYDSGTISLTVNGFTKTVYWGEGSTTDSIAANLFSAFNSDGSSPVRAHVSGSNVSVSAERTGSDTCYPLSGSYTFDQGDFGLPSFKITVSASSLAGCK